MILIYIIDFELRYTHATARSVAVRQRIVLVLLKVNGLNPLSPTRTLTKSLRTVLTKSLRTVLTKSLRTVLTKSLRTVLTKSLRTVLTKSLRTVYLGLYI